MGKVALAFPVLTGPIVDEANVLSYTAEQKISSILSTSQHQIVVTTLNSLEGKSIEEYGVELGRHWQIGEKGNNNGVLLIVAPNEGYARIEVGYGLEGSLTDAVSSLIISQDMLPFLKEKNFEKAILLGVQDIIKVTSGETFIPHNQTSGPNTLQVGLILLVVILFIYVAIAPQKDRARRLRMVLFFLSFIPGKGRIGFKGKGGSFGGGGASHKFK